MDEVVNTTIATKQYPGDAVPSASLHSLGLPGISGRRCVRSIDGNCGRQSNIIFDQCFVRPVDPGITSVRICPSTRANRGGSFEVSMVTSSTQCPRSSRSRRLHIRVRTRVSDRPVERGCRIEDRRQAGVRACSLARRRTGGGALHQSAPRQHGLCTRWRLRRLRLSRRHIGEQMETVPLSKSVGPPIALKHSGHRVA